MAQAHKLIIHHICPVVILCRLSAMQLLNDICLILLIFIMKTLLVWSTANKVDTNSRHFRLRKLLGTYLPYDEVSWMGKCPDEEVSRTRKCPGRGSVRTGKWRTVMWVTGIWMTGKYPTAIPTFATIGLGNNNISSQHISLLKGPNTRDFIVSICAHARSFKASRVLGHQLGSIISLRPMYPKHIFELLRRAMAECRKLGYRHPRMYNFVLQVSLTAKPLS